MGSVLELIAQAGRAGIRLWVEQLDSSSPWQLKFRAPKGAMTAELKQQLKANKQLLIDFLADQLTSQQNPIQNSIVKAEVAENGLLPLSFAQQRMWFLYRLQPESYSYNMPFGIKLTGDLNLAALTASVEALTQRHSLLSARFQEADGQPWLTVGHPSNALALEDLSNHIDPVKAADQQALAEMHHQFDLLQAAPFRARLIKVADKKHLLLLTLHHIIGDGWSTRVLMNELAALYQSQLSGAPANLSELSIQYPDFSVWQKNWLSGDRLDKQLGYWKNKLNHLPALKLPESNAQADSLDIAGGHLSSQLSLQQTSRIKAFCREQQITPFMLLLACWQLLLHRVSGQSDFASGTPVAGRNHKELEGLIGFFVNTLVLRADFSGNLTVVELLQQVKKTMLDAQEHQDVPFEKMVDHLLPERQIGESPFFQNMFILQTRNASLQQADASTAQASQNGASDQLQIEPLPARRDTSNFDLIFHIADSDAYKIDLLWRKAKISQVLAQQLLNAYQPLLLRMIDQPQQSLVNLSTETDQQLVSPMQRDIWLSSQQQPDSLQNTLGYAAHLHADVNIELWQQSLQMDADHFSVLRSGFVAGAGQELAFAKTSGSPFAFAFHDFQSLQLTETALKSRINQFIERPFDIEAGTPQALMANQLWQISPNHFVTVFTSHHALMDGAAGMAHLQRIIERYQSLIDGSIADFEIGLPADLHSQMVLEQRAATDRADAIEFWQAKLANAQGLSFRKPLLFDKGAGGSAEDFLPNGSEVNNDPQNNLDRVEKTLKLDAVHIQALRKYCRQNLITPAIYFQGLYGLLIAHYCRADADFAISEFHSGRNRSNADQPGCYYQLAPFIFNHQALNSNSVDDLWQWLSSERKSLKQAGSLSILKQQQLLPQSEIGFSYNFLNFMPQLSFAGQAIDIVRRTPLANGQVQLLVELVKDHLALYLDYSSNDFSDLNLLDRLAHISAQLLGISENDHQQNRAIESLNQLSFLLPDEIQSNKNKLLGEQSQPLNDDVQLRFEAQAEQSAKSIAVICGEQQLSYLQLNQQANQLAHYLNQRGVKAGDTVAICLPRCIEWPMAILAIIKSGAAYLPMDADIPVKRKQYMVEDSSAKLLIDCDWLAANSAELTTLPTSSLPSAAQASDAFYQVYTSGSTGQPKGAAVSRGNIQNLHSWFTRQYQIASTDKSLLVSAFGFDLTQKNLLAVLLQGGTLVIPDMTVFEPKVILDTAQQQQITLINAAPSAFYPLVEDQNHWPQLASLRQLWLGGEPIAANRLQAWLASDNCNTQIDNTYGPTECADITTFERIDFAEVADQGAMALGRPIDGLQLQVVDSQLRPVIPGLAGELVIAGASLGLGYPADAAKTDQVFVSDTNNQTVYRTGDLVRQWLIENGETEGRLEYLNRIDFQIKLRGMRIEPAEIEAAISSLPGVSDSRVLVDKNNQTEQLRSWVVGDQTVIAELIEQGSWRTNLAESLPLHMIPASFEYLAQWPLTANGKVDRKALLATTIEQKSQKIELPQGEVEQKLATIWQQLLPGLEIGREIGRNSHFFEIGGHSLLAVQLASRIRDQFQQELPLRQLFEAPTLQQQAQLIQKISANSNAGLPALVAQVRPAQIPLSFAQQRLWFIEQLNPASAAYHMPAALELDGEVNVTALEQAFLALIQQQEILRTRLPQANGQAWQEIAEAPDNWTLPISQFNADVSEAQLQQQVKQKLAQPFDFVNGPLWRAELIKIADNARHSNKGHGNTSKPRHILLLCMHHIISDGWSISRLTESLAYSYQEYLQQQSVQLPALTVQYADFSIWQRTWLDKQQLELQTAYWSQQLSGIENLHLNTDFNRPKQINSTGASHEFIISKRLSNRLTRLLQQQNATLFHGLLASWQLLLSKLTGQSDFATGTPVAGREHSQLEPLIGFFVNTLALRSDFSEQPSFVDLIQRCKNTMLDAQQHQHLSFEKLVDELSIERNLQQTPIFQNLLVLQNTPKTEISSTDSDASALLIKPFLKGGLEQSKFDIQLTVSETENAELNARLVYQTALFKPQTIQRIAAQFCALLESLLEQPQVRVDQLDWLPEADRLQLAEFNQQPEQLVSFKALPDRLVALAKQYPDSAAVLIDQQSLSFSELDCKSTQLAGLLQQHNAQPETVVASFLPRSLEQIIALWAIWKSGAAWLPLDPAFPPARIQQIIEDANAVALISQQHLVEQVSAEQALNLPIILLDQPWDQSCEFTPVNYSAENLAYLIFTSGSTGKPKGVQIEQGALHHLLITLNQAINNQSENLLGKRVAVNASVAFDGAIKQLMQTSLGATLVLIPDALRLEVRQLSNYLLEKQVDSLDITPSLLQVLVSENLPLPKQLLIGGEAISVSLWQALAEKELSAFNVYGPSENTVDATVKLISGENSCLGKPLANQQIFLLDDQLNPVAVGAVGQIALAGPQLARGYLNDSGLTQQKFVSGQHLQQPRIYLTGDLGYLNANGELCYAGRCDQQLKLRGYRIEAGEIESLLQQHHQVKSAVVRTRQQQLVAWLVCDPNADKTRITSELTSQLRRQLPEYMLPTSWQLLENLPLNRSGKLDEKALPVVDFLQDQLQFEAPQGDTEIALASIWAELLEQQNISRNANFFRIGGHSLLATRMAAKVRTILGRDLPVRQIFETQQLSELATAINGLPQVVARPALLARSAEYNQKLPLSFAQQRLWFIDHLAGGSVPYNMSIALKIDGDLNVDALSEAFKLLIKRHSALRTIFPSDANQNGGQPWQEILDGDGLQLSVESFKTDNWQDLAKQLASEDAAHSFELDQQWLFRARLVCFTGENTHAAPKLLLLCMHHIIGDGWSNDVLLHDLSVLYQQQLSAPTSVKPLARLPIDYADYALWQRNWLQDQPLAELVDWWKSELDGVDQHLDLRPDRPHLAQMSSNGASVPFQIEAGLLSKLEQLAEQQNITLFMLLISAWQLLLSRHANGQQDFCIGIPVAGRDQTELENLVGFFVNGLVLRTDLTGNPSLVELFARVKQRLLNVYEHQDLPVEMLVEALDVQRNTRRAPLVQTAFAFQQQAVGETSQDVYNQAKNSSGQLSFSPLNVAKTTAKYELTLFSRYNTNQSLTGSLEYNSDLFDAETAQLILQQLQTLLQQMANQPDAAIVNLPSITQPQLIEQLQLDAKETEAVLPLTPMQRDMYLSSLQHPQTLENTVGYLAHFHLESGQVLDLDIWQQAVQMTSDFSSAMRLKLVASKQRGHALVWQVIQNYQDAGFSFKDCLADDFNRQQAVATMRQQLIQPFDLSDNTKPLFANHLWKITDQHYIAMLVGHHLVMDGAAGMVHLQQVCDAYQALIKGNFSRFATTEMWHAQSQGEQQATAIEQLNASFNDDQYAVFISQNLQQMDRSSTLAFWKDRLAGQASNLQSLDFRLPHQSPVTNQVISRQLSFDPQHSKAIRSYCRKMKITPALYFEGLYALLIQHYCRADGDFIISEFNSGRNKQMMQQIACCYQLQPFLIQQQSLVADQPVEAFWAAIKQERKAIKQHCDLSVMQLSQLLPNSRIGFSYNFINFLQQVEFSGNNVEIDRATPLAEGQVQLLVEMTSDQLTLFLDYQQNIFSDLQFLQRIACLSHEFLAFGNQTESVTLGQLSLLLPEEKPWLVGHEVGLPGWDIQQKFEYQAARSPQQIAVICGDSQLSYRQLNQRANQLAELLRQQGVSAGDRLAICLPRHTDWFIAIWAAVKIGAAYVPMDADYPPARLQYLLENSQSKILLTHQSIQQRIEQWIPQQSIALALDVLQQQNQLENFSASNVQQLASADDLFYLIYTSGSTGNPKGAAVSRANVANLQQWFINQYQISDQDKSLIISAFGFDLTQKNLFACLLVGGTVVLPEMDQFDPMLVRDQIYQQQITLLNAAPSAFYPLLDTEKDWPLFSSLRQIWLGGEPIVAARLANWVASNSCRAQIANTYGPTECTDIAVAEQLDWSELVNTDSTKPSNPIALGRPVDNVQLLVLDSQLRPVAPGLPGELCIAGAGVGAGYFQDDEKTQQVFIQHPLLDKGQKLYRTGDLVRLWAGNEENPDGRLEYLNRIDFQLKLRGLRIEPGEIEAAICSLDAVEDARVLVDKSSGTEQLRGFAVTGQQPLLPEDWRQLLSQQIPTYMVPASIDLLAEWPLTPNGKVDRKQLLLQVSDQQKAQQLSPLQSETEHQLAEIYAELLNQSEIGRESGFFELGGHSLLATRLMSRIREQFELELPLRAVFETPQLQALAKQIDQQLLKTENQQNIPVLAAVNPRPENIPLSFAQQRLWFIDQMDPGSLAYHMPSALMIEGALNLAALEQTFIQLIQRHESLRTRFIEHDGKPQQQIDPQSVAELWQLQLDKPQHAENNEAEIKQLARQKLTAPFDLQNGPLWRVELIEVSDNQHLLLLCMHHIISDGWSINRLTQEMAVLYQAISSGMSAQQAASRLPALECHYADFALWQRQWLVGQPLQQQLDFWLDNLSQVEDLQLATDYVRPAKLDPAGAGHSFEVDAVLGKQLKKHLSDRNITLFSGLLAGWQLLLSRISGQSQFATGVPVAGRDQQALEPLIGFFVNTLALKADFTKDLNFNQLLEQTQTNMLIAQQHQHLPFEKLVDELVAERHLNQTPIFQNLLVLQNNQTLEAAAEEQNQPISAEALQIRPYFAGAVEQAKFDLQLNASELESGAISLNLSYRSALYKTETISALADGYLMLIERLLLQPELAVSELWPEANSWQEGRTHQQDQNISQLLQLNAVPADQLLQQQLIAICSDLLQRDDLDTASQFFNSGGHSLLATQLVARVRDQLDCEIPVRQIFETPVIGDLATAIQQLNQQQLQQQKMPALVVQTRPEQIPLSFGQQRLWFIDQMASNAAYNMSTALILKGQLNVNALGQSVDLLIARHEALRTVFPANEGQPWQQINSVLDGQLTVSQHQSESWQQDLQQRTDDEAGFCFDLQNGPLYRFQLIDYSNGCYGLLLNMHHIISDGWSVDRMIQELVLGYQLADELQQANIADLINDARLPELPIQYADYAIWQRDWLQPEVLDQQLQWWRDRLYKTPSQLELKPDQPWPEQVSSQGQQLRFSLSAQQTAKIEAICQQQQITPFMLLASVWQIQLSQLAGGQQQFCIGAPVAGRNHQALENLVGFFINGLILPVDLTGNLTFDEYLQRNRQTILDVFDYQHLPVEMILDQLDLPRDSRRQPLVQAGFAWQNLSNQSNDLASEDASGSRPNQPLNGLQVSSLPPQRNSAKYELNLILSPQQKGGQSQIAAVLEYRSDLFLHATAEKISSQFCQLLDKLLAESQQSLVNLSTETDQQLVSPMQRDIWLSSQQQPDSLQNTLGYAAHLHADVNIELWQQSLQMDADHFSVLRSGFVAGTGQELAFAKTSDSPFAFAFHDYQSLQLTETALKSRINQFIERPFDIEAGTPQALMANQLWQISPNHFVTVFTSHHALMDGAAGMAHLQRIIERYQSLIDGSIADFEIGLPADLHSQMVLEQRAATDRADAIEFWQAKLANAQGLSFRKPLLFDKGAGGSAEDFLPNGSEVNNDPQNNLDRVEKTLKLDAVHIQALRKYCRQNLITPAIYFQGLYGLLIAHYCRADADFAISEFHSGRNRSNADQPGCYYQLAPFIFNHQALNSNSVDDLWQWLSSERKSLKQAGSLSILKQQQLLPQSEIGFSYNFLNFMPQLSFAGQAIDIVRRTPLANGQVQLLVELVKDHLALYLDYSSNDFSDLNLLDRLAHISAQLLGISENDHQQNRAIESLNQLSFLLPDEIQSNKNKLLGEQSQPLNDDVQLRFEAQAEQSAKSIAVICGEQQLSYLQLNQQANQLAHYLNQRGVKAGDTVAICLPRCIEWPMAILAIIKSGAAYLPMDADIPVKRKQYMVEDSSAKLLIDCDWLAANSAELTTLPTSSLPSAAQASDAFYQVYTSGSTGQPKGAAVSRGNIQNLHSWFTRQYQIASTDKSLLVSAFGFDLTQKNLLAVLLQGGTLVIPDMTVFEPKVILDTAQQQQITLINAAPSAFYPLVEDQNHWPQLASLRQLWLGGEPIAANRLQAWLASDNCNTQIDNTYGPTECADITTFERIDFAEVADQGAMALGRPIDGLQLQVVDSQLRPVIPGLAGELVIAGASLGLGYPADAAKTDQVFVSDTNNQTVYRTGDLVRQWLIENGETEGRLEYLNRIDFQIKLRGMRIEPAEIEAAISSLPGVSDSRVLVDKNNQTEQLRSWVVGDQTVIAELIEQGSWRTNLAESLPLHMIPASFEYLAQWPLTANGKVDRKALLATTIEQKSQKIELPQGEVEQKLATIWQQLLPGLEIGREIGRNSHFFEIGGHSLLATRMAAQAANAFSIELSVREIFLQPQLQQLASKMVELQLQQANQPLLPLVAQTRNDQPSQLMPLSLAQQRLWLVHQLNPQSLAYHMPFVLRLTGKLDAQRLENAFKALIERHEILRSGFVTENDLPQQMVQKEINWSLQQVDLDSTGTELRPTIQALLSQPFDLQQAGLLRAALIEENSQQQLAKQPSHVLVICLHHIVSDGMSTEILARELMALYQSQADLSVLPTLPIQYADFASWQKQWLTGERLNQQQDYWKQQLNSVEDLQLATDFPRSQSVTDVAASIPLSLTAQQLAGLQQLAASADTTLFAVLNASVQLLLSRYTGQQDFALGTPVSGRNRLEVEGLIGFFVNTLVLRADLSGAPNFNQLVQRSRNTCLDAWSYQDLPFDQVTELTGQSNRQDRSPLFQAMILLNQMPAPADKTSTKGLAQSPDSDSIAVEALSAAEDGKGRATIKFDLTFSFNLSQDKLNLSLDYRKDLFAETSMQAIADSFSLLTDAVLEHPELPVNQLELGAAEGTSVHQQSENNQKQQETEELEELEF
ncbi:non-ribosomal peptide synthetase [Pelagibaculum spongiae]|uniref:Carrier domain-containing protein n=1 Tax=Pelagibaculum spongiae TaxID=2080658 RepID=A0A2V1GZS4_9GAMM|nr:non-ribosomal peptide synthetase [Pelagibaculum spongiae]PVZ68902.1 hypothetical protein DC094_11660 [Pelagibaculum spongiae]